MDFQHVNVKLLVAGEGTIDLEPLIPVFHRWIQGQVCDELLLDIADYRHVPWGPGVVLIGHQADYSVDHANGRWGVRYNRKAPFDGTNQDRLRQATCSALRAFQRLEAEAALSGSLRFNGRDIEVFINDRMLAPNREDVRRALDGEFKTFFDKFFGTREYAISFDCDPRRLLGVTAHASKLFTVRELMANLAS